MICCTKAQAMAHKFNAAVLAIVDVLDGDRKTGKATCPVCGKHALSVTAGKWQPAIVYCFGGDGDHSNEVVAKLREMGVWPTSLGLERLPAAEEHRSEQDRRRYAVQIWEDLRESGRRMAYLLLGYLSQRGIKEVPITARLTMPIAYHDSRTLSHDPGMVLPLMNKKAVVQGIHAIWLNGGLSGKREAEPQRQSYGLVKGNFIPLFEFDPKRRLTVLLIGEGPETVMAAMQLTGLPGIATAGKSFMAHLDPPPADAYILLVDLDDNGGSRKAAGELAARLLGCTVRIALPKKPKGGKCGYDWNDALLDAGAGKSKLAKLGKMITEAPPFETVMTVEEKREVRLNALAVLTSLTSSNANRQPRNCKFASSSSMKRSISASSCSRRKGRKHRHTSTLSCLPPRRATSSRARTCSTCSPTTSVGGLLARCAMPSWHIWSALADCSARRCIARSRDHRVRESQSCASRCSNTSRRKA